MRANEKSTTGELFCDHCLLSQYDASIQRMYVFKCKMQLGSDSNVNLSKIFPSLNLATVLI